PRSFIPNASSRRTRAADARCAVVLARLGADRSAARFPRGSARVDSRRPPCGFPIPHRLEMSATLSAHGLPIETILVAGSDGDVPVSFGFHPYFGLADFPRPRWRLKLPAMRRLTLDDRGIPTGAEASFDGLDAELGELAFDDGFALMAKQASFSVTGAGRQITVDFLEGYTHAQVYAPKDNDYIALEPMTAPASALTSGRGLRLVKSGERFRAAFRICIEAS